MSNTTTRFTMLSAGHIELSVERSTVLYLFVAGNFFFLTVDVSLSHLVTGFVNRYTLIPMISGPIGALAALYFAFARKPRMLARLFYLLIMLMQGAVGVVGAAFHLYSALAPETKALSWQFIIFSAPVLAPLSFSGVACVGLAAMLPEERPMRFQVPGLAVGGARSKSRVLLWLVALGLVSATLSALFDHARGGYIFYEWIPIGVGFFGAIIVAYHALADRPSAEDVATLVVTFLGLAIVGVLGFGFHLGADVTERGHISWQRLLTFAPPLVPFIFTNLSVLGAIAALEPDVEASASPAGT
jgi:hypothetical protein